jgi:hypothetical protein
LDVPDAPEGRTAGPWHLSKVRDEAGAHLGALRELKKQPLELNRERG